MSQPPGVHNRSRFNSRMTHIVLLISFLFFFGRFVYSSVSAWHQYQNKNNTQQLSLVLERDSVSR
ncbi:MULTISPECIES: YfgG family protein [Tenebrionibacter/Tenebrionicola group]|uniref:DUF2633 family protein n=2 Tax=Tenebrionibacter/Tenebrionicola group TaxID=2969848 RepID=A0A8K0V1V9_9ENTR|nr:MULTISPECIES: DUF2633 family protein [Tenebrionibacter/Tenebrionicola group]MBK4715477.1 DUF2633 family protein [Tenebrionibacter intestinalis]MBV4411762.1 DUF2633 family protein [Tenebrionicola larvae]MBV5094990.1 DUF2633 family protein [Tenebrionicola larvae]